MGTGNFGGGGLGPAARAVTALCLSQGLTAAGYSPRNRKSRAEGDGALLAAIKRVPMNLSGNEGVESIR
jgi:hypothetical protein